MVHVEIWKSDNNRQERHYFLKDGEGHAYQNADYLFGINPKYFNEDKINRILAMLDEDAGNTMRS